MRVVFSGIASNGERRFSSLVLDQYLDSAQRLRQILDFAKRLYIESLWREIMVLL